VSSLCGFDSLVAALGKTEVFFVFDQGLIFFVLHQFPEPRDGSVGGAIVHQDDFMGFRGVALDACETLFREGKLVPGKDDDGNRQRDFFVFLFATGYTIAGTIGCLAMIRSGFTFPSHFA